ncbi:hypothetical protein PR202_ga10007 [Eleusine coracana subsp. coracana]|uniref:Uncharacterized protein n=1 Tax=Eleusine coracana subsp. coracana TaxID=191504 RepID=A0AAV5C5M3_ELECO|nr:hypothetical protein PR202_ga10007 [Eleusine coracana subsp. coracana]
MDHLQQLHRTAAAPPLFPVVVHHHHHHKQETTPPPTPISPAGTATALDTLLGALRATWTTASVSAPPPPSTSIQPLDSQSHQSGKDEHANDLILSAAGLLSSSSVSSDSQNAASSVLFGDTHFNSHVDFASLLADARNGCSNSCAAVGRSPAFLAKQQARKLFPSADIHAGTSGTASVYPILCTAANTSSSSTTPLHGARPVAISTTVHPTAHTSAAGPCSSPRATSVAMNAGVPPIGRAGSPAAAIRAHPKSASLARPSAPTTTFRGLTSPCTTERAWRYASPRATSAAYATTARSSRRPPFRAAASASDPPGAYSRKRWYSSSSPAPPMQRRTWGEERPDITACSRRSAAEAAEGARADLTAKSCPEAASAARDTTAPDAPRPSVCSRVQCLISAAAATMIDRCPLPLLSFFLCSMVVVACCCCSLANVVVVN